MIDEVQREKRRNETHLEWQQRIDRLDDAGEGLIVPTLETMQHGDYREEFVTHVETNTKAQVRRNRQQSSLVLLWEREQIDDQQLLAAAEIARCVEMIERSVAVRGASLEARVDNAGAGRDVLVERLTLVRIERTYALWRERLPTPKRMVIDMLTGTTGLKAVARRYGRSLPVARNLMIDALNRWLDLRDRVWRSIDREDVEWAQKRVGGGWLL